jgi:hypothetical protein
MEESKGIFRRIAGLAQSIAEPRGVWSMALYAQTAPFSTKTRLKVPHKLFDTKRIDLTGRSPHTYADPFVYVHDNILYVFFEEVQRGGHGEIAALSTSDLVNFKKTYPAFDHAYHVSFPYVFDIEKKPYMIPESSKNNSIDLYEFDDFPTKLRKVRTLLVGDCADSHVFMHDNKWFLFTTIDGKLNLFFTDDLLAGVLTPHPMNPLTSDLRISRSAGAALTLDGRLYRSAQDCSNVYGENISLIEIEELTTTSYRERVVVDKFFSLDKSWNANGAHHLSICEFYGKTVIATDGKQTDYFINRFSALYRSLFRLEARHHIPSSIGRIVASSANPLHDRAKDGYHR